MEQKSPSPIDIKPGATGALPKTSSINWTEIAVFFVIAVGVSAPFRLDWITPAKWLPFPYGLDIFYAVLRGIGPACGYLVVTRFLKSTVIRDISFWGVNGMISFLAMLILPVMMAIVGTTEAAAQNKHYLGCLYGVMLVLYALGEEYGWRGYLQPALAPMRLFPKVMLIAVLWYLWHLNFLRPGISPKMHLIHFLSLVAGSWGLLKIADTTKSILFTAAVHLSFNVLADGTGRINSPLLIIGVAGALWFALIRFGIIGRAVAVKER